MCIRDSSPTPRPFQRRPWLQQRPLGSAAIAGAHRAAGAPGSASATACSAQRGVGAWGMLGMIVKFRGSRLQRAPNHPHL
eukprot:9135211-Alexandrium_andersonii.AAC.1